HFGATGRRRHTGTGYCLHRADRDSCYRRRGCGWHGHAEREGGHHQRGRHGYTAHCCVLWVGESPTVSVSWRLKPNSSIVNVTSLRLSRATRRRPRSWPTRTRYCSFVSRSRRIATDVRPSESNAIATSRRSLTSGRISPVLMREAKGSRRPPLAYVNTSRRNVRRPSISVPVIGTGRTAESAAVR